MGVGGQRHAPAAFTPGKDPVPIVQEAGWPPGPVWIGAENLAPTGIRSPDRPTCSESLYRLSYPGPQVAYRPWFKLRTSPTRYRRRQAKTWERSGGSIYRTCPVFHWQVGDSDLVQTLSRIYRSTRRHMEDSNFIVNVVKTSNLVQISQ
jgi:hypothetical protein